MILAGNPTIDMKLLHHSATLQTLAKALGKPCMYVRFPTGDLPHSEREILKAAPWLDIENDTDNHVQALSDETAIAIFDSEEEMDRIYEQTVGDDGPTETNPYNGKARVYCLTCDANGELRNENT